MNQTRRQFLEFSATGLGAAALMGLLGHDQATAAAPLKSNSSKPQARAKRVIHICLMGGLSHLDSFDYKPTLEKLHGKSAPPSVKPDSFFGSAGLVRQNEWKFKQRGESGLWVSDLFPHIAGVADELTVIKSMQSDSANHTPASFLQNSGFATNGFPSLGSWLSYGLGNESEDLPTFIVLPDARSLPNNGASNWSSGFLPAEHQGSLFGSGEQPIRNLFSKKHISRKAEEDARQLLAELNTQHAAARPEQDLLAARIKSYEVAARMQVSVPEVVKYDDEPNVTALGSVSSITLRVRRIFRKFNLIFFISLKIIFSIALS